MAKDKRARKKVDVRGGKRPAIQASATNNQHLSWRIGSVDVHGAWGWSVLDMPTLGYIREKLAHFETMTWNELQGARHKFIPTDHIADDAKRRLEEIGRDDIDGLWELRFSGPERLWGIRVGDVMHIIWWDPQHTVCPSSR